MVRTTRHILRRNREAYPISAGFQHHAFVWKWVVEEQAAGGGWNGGGWGMVYAASNAPIISCVGMSNKICFNSDKVTWAAGLDFVILIRK